MENQAELFQQALDALQEQNFARALELLESAAEGGLAEAQYQLGIMHANGEGVPLDYVQAARWIRRAAEQDYAPAQSLIAWLHASGYGVVQDDGEAGHWYLRAAQQGLAKAQYTVAAMYRWGRYGVTKDPREMIHWYHRAADQGFAPAQYALGQLLALGEEVARDDDAAFQWLSLAIVNGSEPAKRALMELTQRMTPEHIEAVKQRVFETAGTPPGDSPPLRRDVGHAL